MVAMSPIRSRIATQRLQILRMALVLSLAFLMGGAMISSVAMRAPIRTQAQPIDQLPDGAGKPIVQRACTTCHTLNVITTRRASQPEWAKTVDDMVNRGADLSDDDIDKVVDYLSTNFKPTSPDTKPPVARAPPPQK